MADRHELRQPLDADLLTNPVGVYEGELHEVLGKMIVSRLGIAIFPEADLEIIAADLGARGYMPAGHTGNSQVSGGTNGTQGDIRRLDDKTIIVHRTLAGTGKANFFWPVSDYHGFRPDYVFDPSRDKVHLRASRIPLSPDRVIVFPSSTWHQFGSDPFVNRISTYRQYWPTAKTPQQLQQG